jgi:hypothetical protein
MKKLTLVLCLLLPLAAAAQVLGSYSNAWAVQHQPAATTAATITRAAVAARRHIATSITICTSGVAAQPTLLFNLRDGATGAGTILWSGRLSAAAGASSCVVVPNLLIVGTVNTAMTLESAAAPASTNFATVALTGHTIGK